MALGVVGHALGAAIEAHPRLRHPTRIRTDPKLACFPGASAAYGAHYDGGQLGEACKLTSILYCNEGWREADGGRLHLLDEANGCWRTVAPSAGRLLLFRVAGCLHKVEPCHAERFAITAWWCEPNSIPEGQPRRTVTIRVANKGPQRFEALADDARHEARRRLEAFA